MDKFYFGSGVEFSYGTQKARNVSSNSRTGFHLGDMHIVPNLRGDQVKSEMSREYSRSNSGGLNASTHNSGLFSFYRDDGVVCCNRKVFFCCR